MDLAANDMAVAAGSRAMRPRAIRAATPFILRSAKTAFCSFAVQGSLGMWRIAWIIAGVAMLGTALPGSASAQTMPLNEFIATADRIPRNPLALLRSDYRRLKREVEASLILIATAQYRAREANQPPQTCLPDTFTFNTEATLGQLKAIPEPRRRRMTITDGLREVIRRQYPCP